MGIEGKTLLDSWTVEEMMPELNKETSVQSNNIAKSSMAIFYTSLLLFDETNIVLTNNDSHHFDSFVKFVDSNFLSQFCKMLFQHFTYESSDYFGYDKEGSFVVNDYDSIISRTDMYIDYSSKLGMSYFPHPKRAAYLIDQLNKPKKPDRRVALDIVEKRLQEFYDEINDIAGGNGWFNCSVPLLYDYICANAESPTEQLEVVLSLRKDKNVVKFRKSLNIMDELLNDGRRADYFRVLKTIDELAKEIINDYTKKTTANTLKVKYTFPLKVDVSKEIEVTLPSIPDGRVERKLHLTFLADLLSFGLNNRK